jgi:hypothetical protein
LQASSGRTELIFLFGRFAVGLLMLIVLRFVVLSLPMMRDLGFAVNPFSNPYRAGLTWALLFDIVLRTWIIYLLLNFGARLYQLLPQMFQELPALGTMAFLAMAFVAVLVGYFAYDALIVPPLSRYGYAWVYSMAFLLAAIAALIGIGFLLYQNFEQLLVLLRTFQLRSATIPPPPPTVKPATPTISAVVHSAEEASQSAATQPSCSKCGWVASPGDIFCIKCGEKLSPTTE